MKKGNIISLIISGTSFITLIVFLSLLLGEQLQVRSCGCPKMVSQNFVMLFIFLSIVFIGSLFYYLFSLQIQKKDKKVEFNINTIMKFLDNDEKTIIKQLKDKEEMFQSNIKKLTRLRKHRAIKKLNEKNIIQIEKEKGKNKIKLNKNLRLK